MDGKFHFKVHLHQGVVLTSISHSTSSNILTFITKYV